MKTFLQSIGSYQIIEKLGRGGMADVYLALDSRTNSRVALKLVEHGAGQDAAAVVAAERLGAELQAHLGAVDPRIPRINSYGDIDEFFCIDMEYIEGRDLSECIRAGLDSGEAARIGAELCSILAVAHSTSLQVDGRELRAVVHGDIKPKNIRIDTENRVRVLDFGIAKGLSLTRKLTSNFFGSVSYASPERLDTGRIDESSDLWAAGVVLYEMLGGQPPFEAPSTESLETVVRSRTPPRPLPEECPLELRRIVYKALAQSPGRRYQTAREFEADLRGFLAGELTVASMQSEETRRTGPAEDAPAPPATGPVVSPAPPPAAVTAGVETRRTRTLPPWWRKAKTILKIAVPALLVLVLVWEGIVYRDAKAMEHTLVTQQLDSDQAWTNYEGIRSRSVLGLAPLVLRAPLIKLLTERCQSIADEYRNSDAPRVREGDWVRCRRDMQRVRQLDPTDRRAAAMTAYADGQILRINRKDVEAVAAFQRAASLDSKWPDPHLGMARVYIYGLKDYDRGTKELERAEDLGHRPGRREQAQRADAFKNRGFEYWQGATKLRDQPQEKEMLSKAKDDLEKALDIYSEIVPWGDTTTQIRQVQDALNKIQDRLEVVDPPGSIFSWKWWKHIKIQ